MTADTLASESETDTVRRFHSIEDMIIFHNPHFEYLLNLTLPVRPPTEEEAAAYKARYEAPDWAEIYSPGEPRIVLPPSAPELTALLPVALASPAEPDGDPEALTGVVVPDEPRLAEAQQDGLASLKRWTRGADTGSLSVVRDEPEVHHNDTQVLHVTPEATE